MEEGSKTCAMHGDMHRSEGGDTRNKGIAAKGSVELQSEPGIVSEDDAFFSETQASEAQSGADDRPSKHVTVRRVDPESGAGKSNADALEPNEGNQADWEVIDADEETSKSSTADRMMAAAAADGAAGRRASAGSLADAKSGKSAAAGIPRRANAKRSGFTRIAAGARDSSGDSGSDGGVLLDTWEEKQKEVE